MYSEQLTIDKWIFIEIPMNKIITLITITHKNYDSNFSRYNVEHWKTFLKSAVRT